MLANNLAPDPRVYTAAKAAVFLYLIMHYNTPVWQRLHADDEPQLDAPNGEHVGPNGATPAMEPLPPSVGATPGERSLLTPLHPRSDAKKSAKSARSKKVD